jgi:dolichol-phosphate mannosyltransferase
LSRNFGLQSALTAGLARARGKAVIVMDADLQDDPAALPTLIGRWRNNEADVVFAIRSEREERWFRKATTDLFYWLTNKVADVPIPRDAGSYALYDKRIVEHINSLPEANRYLPGLRAWVGHRQLGVPVARRKRRHGQPRQSISRLTSLALDGLLSFSKVPLRIATITGFIVLLGSIVGLGVIVYWRFIQRSFPAGVGLATIALALLFLGGVQLLLLGTLGEYIGRIYDEVKRRPHFIVEKEQKPHDQ